MPDAMLVLHVTSDPEFGDVVESRLGQDSDLIEVEHVLSASEGVDYLDSTEIDCVISDYDMPGRTGIGFLELIREDYPDLPFILFTDESSEAVVSEAFTAGVTDYFDKNARGDSYAILANRIENAVRQYRAERAVERSDRRFLDLAENSNDILWMFAADWSEVLFINSAYEDIWGRSTDTLEACPTDFLNGVHPEDREDVRQAMDRLTNGEPIDVEYRVNEGEDYRRWVWVQGEPVRDETGSVDRIAGFARDITERKRRERELQRKTRRLDAVIQNTSESIYIKDTEGRYLLANESDAELFGLEPEEMKGKRDEELFDPVSLPDIRAIDERVLDSGETFTEEVVTFIDGEKHVFLDNKYPYRDSDGEIIGVIGVSRDITDRKQREQELEQFKMICESLQDGIYVFDEEYRLTYCNESYAQMKGLSREELLGRPLTDLAGDEVLERGRRLREEMIKGNRKDAVIQHDLRTDDGDTIPVENRFVPLPFEDDFRGTTGVIRDISERKARQRELERQNKRLEEFASIVSHDLRNPLQVAKGRLRLARETRDHKHLDDVDQALDRMESLIEDLLTVTHEGDRAIEIVSIDLTAIVKSCWATVETSRAGLVIETEGSIRADESQFKQLLENLIGNAVTHGGEDVTIRIGEFDDASGLYVEDDGPGIPPDERDEVFNPGYSTDTEGTGLGLTIVNQIVEAHGWDIRVREGNSGGARFEITGVAIDHQHE